MSGPQNETTSYQPEILQLEITPKEENNYLEYIRANGLDKARVLKQIQYLTVLMAARPKTFESYTRDSDGTVEEGNSFVTTTQPRLATGFNIVRDGDHFPITSSDSYILYSMYIRRVAHMAVLLAEMEQLGIITEDQVRFGNKVSAVELGDWKLDPRDEIEVAISIPQTDPNLPPIRTQFCHTAETTVIFKPKNEQNAIEIAAHLIEKTYSDAENSIPESWLVPDIRATSGLNFLLNAPELKEETGESLFSEAITNVKHFPNSTLFIMSQDRTFEPNVGWAGRRNPINTELYRFLEVKIKQ